MVVVSPLTVGKRYVINMPPNTHTSVYFICKIGEEYIFGVGDTTPHAISSWLDADNANCMITVTNNERNMLARRHIEDVLNASGDGADLQAEVDMLKIIGGILIMRERTVRMRVGTYEDRDEKIKADRVRRAIDECGGQPTGKDGETLTEEHDLIIIDRILQRLSEDTEARDSIIIDRVLGKISELLQKLPRS